VSGIVVDTSAWIAYFAGREYALLDDALKQGAVLLPPIVVAELVSGAPRARERAALVEFLQELPLCPADLDHWIRVGNLRRVCREKGLSVSTPDAHVAQCSIDADAPLFSLDSVFSAMARHTALRLTLQPE
jgi:predicted nucleic acid-binding protein